MGKYTRDIIIMVKEEDLLQPDMDITVEKLHHIIALVETREAFCNAHELVKRNRITNKKFRIMNAISENPMKPFYFLINKN